MAYQELFRLTCVDKRSLRNSVGSTSCKMSAILYILIHSLENPTPLLIETKFQEIISNKTLYRLLLNYAIGGSQIVNTKFLTEGNVWYMGLVTPSRDSSIRENIIHHYFLIVRKQDTYWIVSSYGCDLVHMKQSETHVTIQDIETFIYALQCNQRKRIRTFIKKHFLNQQNYVKRYVDASENDGRTTTDLSLLDEEVNSYVKQPYWMEWYSYVPAIVIKTNESHFCKFTI